MNVLKGLNFSKRSVRGFVDERGRRLPGFYSALRAALSALLLTNRRDIPDWPNPRVPDVNRKRRLSGWWRVSNPGREGTHRNASNSHLTWVPPSKPVKLSGVEGAFASPYAERLEAERRQKQSAADLKRYLASKWERRHGRRKAA